MSSDVSESPGHPLRELPALVMTAVQLVWAASKVRAAFLVVVQLLSAASLFASVLLVGRVLEVALLIGRGEATLGRAILPAVMLALLTGVTTVTLSVSRLQQRVLGTLVERAVWRDVLLVSYSVDLRTYDDADFYDQATRVKGSAVWQTQFVVEALVLTGGDLLGAIAGTAGLLAIAPELAPLLILSGVPLLLAARRTGRREFAFAVSQSRREREREYLVHVLTRRNEAKEVRAFALADRLLGTWERNYDAYIRDLRVHIANLTNLTVAAGAASVLLTGAAMVLALVLIARGDLAISQAGAALVALRLLAGRVAGASRGLSDIYGAAFFLRDLMEFRHRAPIATEPSTPADAPEQFDEIRASDIVFRYPDSEEPALKGASIRLRRGEVVALVGENGSGKTTLAKLLGGLYQPDEGSISWDGTDVRQFDVTQLRRRVTVLFQDFIRYRLTAHANIALARTDLEIDDETVRAAAVRADADGFLSALPEGYSTVLSKEYAGGAELSGGQWQRVALARAFLRNAPLVILDEPSASLDARAERDLFQRIRTLFTSRTVLVISHRFSTVREADRIYVLDKGRVVEEGNHTTLMAQDGLYRDLFLLQAKGYLDGADA